MGQGDQAAFPALTCQACARKGWSTIDVIGAVAFQHKFSDEFRRNLQDDLAGEFTPPGQSLSALPQKRTADLAALSGAYKAGLGDSSEERVAFARRRIERAVGIDPKAPLDERTRRVDALLAAARKPGPVTAAFRNQRADRLARFASMSAKGDYDTSWLPSALRKRITGTTFDKGSVTLQFDNGASLRDTGSQIGLLGRFDRDFAEQIIKGISRLGWDSPEIGGNRNFKRFASQHLLALVDPKLAAFQKLTDYVRGLEADVAKLHRRFRPVTPGQIAPNLVSRLRANQDEAKSIAKALARHGEAGWFRRMFSPAWKARWSALNQKLAENERVGGSLKIKETELFAYIKGNKERNRIDEDNIFQISGRLKMAEQAFAAIEGDHRETIHAALSGHFNVALGAAMRFSHDDSANDNTVEHTAKAMNQR